MGVGFRHADDGAVDDGRRFSGEICQVHLDSSVVVLGHNKTVKNHMSQIFSQNPVLQIFIDRKIRVHRRNGRVMRPWIGMVSVISDPHAGVHPRRQNEYSQSETSVGMSHVVADVAEWVACGTDVESS